MTQNQKILLGVGAIALAYFIYKRKGSGISRQAPSNPCKNENEVPCDNGSGKCYSVLAKYSQDPCKVDNPIKENTIPNNYRLKQDFTKSVMTRPNVYADATFKKGQLIIALTNPYLPQNRSLFTTITGEKPNFDMVGQPYISIPESILEKL